MARNEKKAIESRYSKPKAKPDSATTAATDTTDPHEQALSDALQRHETERGQMNKRHMDELALLGKQRMEQQMPNNDGTTQVMGSQ